MKDNLKSGIYKIQNTTNNKVYIGQSINIEHRIYEHTYHLKKGLHYNDYLQRSWNKYGEDNFTIEVVEYCDIKELNCREIYWIKTYKATNRDFGYNIKSGGGCGSTVDEDTKLKQSMIANATGGRISTGRYLRAVDLLETETIGFVEKATGLSRYTLKNIKSKNYCPAERCFDWWEYDYGLIWYVDMFGRLTYIKIDDREDYEPYFCHNDYFDDKLDANELIKMIQDYDDSPEAQRDMQLREDHYKTLEVSGKILKYV